MQILLGYTSSELGKVKFGFVHFENYQPTFNGMGTDRRRKLRKWVIVGARRRESQDVVGSQKC